MGSPCSVENKTNLKEMSTWVCLHSQVRSQVPEHRPGGIQFIRSFADHCGNGELPETIWCAPGKPCYPFILTMGFMERLRIEVTPDSMGQFSGRRQVHAIVTRRTLIVLYYFFLHL